MLNFIFGFLICFAIFILILLVELRLIKTNSTITDRIAKQLEKLKPKQQVSIITPLTGFESKFEKLTKTQDVRLDDLYETEE